MVTTRSKTSSLSQNEGQQGQQGSSERDNGYTRRTLQVDGQHIHPSARQPALARVIDLREDASTLLAPSPSSSTSSVTAVPISWSSDTATAIDVDADVPPAGPAKSSKNAKTTPRKRKRTNDEKDDDNDSKKKPERRARPFRKKPPMKFLERLDRALTQRLCVLKRERADNTVEPSERFTLCGSTGNVYIVVIRKVPSCTCPDAGKGNQCKHIIYVLHNVLKAPEQLEYQTAFLSSEIHQIFDNSPPTPSEHASLEDTDGHRKPVEGECPICFMPLESSGSSSSSSSPSSDVVWCKARCGNNIHKSCFKQWAATVRAEGKEVRCVYCRTPWAPDFTDLSTLLTSATLGEEGYLNLADALNISNDRGTLGTSPLPSSISISPSSSSSSSPSSSSMRGSLATLFVTSWTHEIIQRIISHGCADDFIVTSDSPRASGLLASGEPVYVDSVVVHWDGEEIRGIDFHCRA